LVPSGGTVVDIGANIGNHALFLSRKAGVVHCFEPNPRAYQRLERNIALNDISNIIVHQHGIGSENAVRHFHDESDGNLGMSRYSPDGELELEVRRGDDVISLDRVDLIKIDVEGMEADVLCGLRRSIRKYRPVVVFEYNGGDWQTIVESLPGYSISEPVFAPLNPSPKLKRVTERPERWVECLIGKSDSSDSNGTA
jgi:FkbM family methyltransferase